jgi:predicted GTPase
MVSLTNNFFIKGIGSLFNYFQNNEKSEKNTKEIENNFEKIKEDFLNIVKQKIEQNQEIYFQNEIASKYKIEKLDDLIKKIYNNENISKLIKEKFQNDIYKIDMINSLKHFNILVLGPTGVGKSTLINSILQFDDKKNEGAKTGIGVPITLGEPKSYENEEKIKGIRLYDSQGIDKDKYEIENLINSVKNLVDNQALTNNPDNFIHCIWYCVTGDRFEIEERNCLIELMNIYDDETMPIILVYTKAFDDEADEAIEEIKNILCEKIKDRNIEILKVVSKEKEFRFQGENIIIEKSGIKDLMIKTFDKVKKAVKSASFYSIKNQVLNNFKDELKEISENKVKKTIFNSINSLATGIRIKYMSSVIFQLFTNIGKFIIFDKNTYKYSNESREEIIIFLQNIDEITNKYFNEYLENFVMVTCLEVALKYKKNIDEKKENKNEILSSIKTGMESFTEKDYINNDKVKEIFAKSQEKMINDLQRKIEDFTFKKGCFYITDNYINKLIEEKIKLYENEILNNNLIIEKKITKNIIDLSNNVNEIINFYK